MRKKVLFLSIIFLLFLTLNYTYSAFRSNIVGTINANVKDWVFKVSVDNGTIKDGGYNLHLSGTSGSFNVNINTNGSKSGADYTIELIGDSSIKFYIDSGYTKLISNNIYNGSINSNTSGTTTIYYKSDNNINSDILIKTKCTIMEIATMKNGQSNSTEFWNSTYTTYIKTITFGNDLSNLPSTCTEENLCWDISESATQKKKVYAYLIDSGLKDSNNPEQSLYNLYIVSDAPIFAPIDCLKIFSDFSNLKTINFNNNFNTSKVTNMQDMFYNNSLLDNIDVSTFNTKNVIDMGGMFAMCGFISLDLSNFNTENLANIFVEEYRRNRSIFSRCPSLTTIDLSSFNTTNVTNMRYMFYVCSSLTSLDLNSFNTTNVTNMNYMFSDCSSLTSLDLSSFNTSKVTNMSNMFSYCSSLTSLDLSNFNTSSVTNMDYMFSDCSSLISLDLSSLKEFKYSGSGDNTGILIDCSSLENLNLRSLTKLNAYIIYNLNNLRDLDISNLYINSDLYLPKSDRLVTTINYIGTYSVYDIKLQKYIPSFNIAVKPSQGKITINYEAAAEPYLDQIISEHPEYNWVKGKLITSPTSS